jgi:hypothetical protein
MEKLKRDHFIKAADYIRNNPIPAKRGPRTYVVPINGTNCPPKWALSVALYISGDNKEICSGKDFITNEALAILESFGFHAVKVKKGKTE